MTVNMTAVWRKAVLTTHVTSSVGWLGAVAAFLALSIAGVTNAQTEVVRAAYLGMHLTTWYVIVPFCLASFLTGVIEGLVTPWGLFRHYWVILKLVLTVLATGILFVHTQPIDRVAALAMQSSVAAADLRALRIQLVGDASAALFVLVVTTSLSIYKPWGMTRYGIQRQLEETAARSPRVRRNSGAAGQYVLIAIGASIIFILVLHLFGFGRHAH